MPKLDRTLTMLLSAYRQGAFPMASSRHGEVEFFCADPRAIVPLDGFRVSRSLRAKVRKRDLVITSDLAFERVVRACADVPRKRVDGEEANTWINDWIIANYTKLHEAGYAHSVEAWVVQDPSPREGPGVGLIGAEPRSEHGREERQSKQAEEGSSYVAGRQRTSGQPEQSLDRSAPDKSTRPTPNKPTPAPPSGRGQVTLVGGLYGVHIGGAFFGESMFSRPDLGGTDASKVCLVHLVAHLRKQGFLLLDSQFANPHMLQFGVVEIAMSEYLERLEMATALDVGWGEFVPTSQ
jgi:Leu/Phe-tRNA-protein transferase